MNSFLDYSTSMQLEQYCQQLHKWDKICCVKTFMLLHNKISLEVEVRLMVQRRKGALKLLPDSTQEEKENEEIGLINVPNPRGTRFVEEDPPSVAIPTISYP